MASQTLLLTGRRTETMRSRSQCENVSTSGHALQLLNLCTDQLQRSYHLSNYRLSNLKAKRKLLIGKPSRYERARKATCHLMFCGIKFGSKLERLDCRVNADVASIMQSVLHDGCSICVYLSNWSESTDSRHLLKDRALPM